ncbi:Ig-like domain repeat protein [Nocardioides halotolerans]|uniref:Ig-like domain repeat protein n=1 Tax=Nocardioides halotolerans TaxID=433660 RepID=UPI00040A218C|nr:Ig-like domain repeat protein [Nocardioides halotolerans]
MLTHLRRQGRHHLVLALATGVGVAGLTVAGSGAASAAAPGNDNIAGATALTPNTLVIGSTDEATLQATEDREDGSTAYRTVWYKYSPGANQDVSFETSSVGDNTDTVITLYTGAPGASAFGDLTYVDSDDDGAEYYSYLAETVSAGSTYFLQVDVYDEDAPHGSFAVRVNLPGAASGVPANDNLAAAARIIPGINATADNRNATTEGTEPQQGACVDPVNNSVWYRYSSLIGRDVAFYSVGASASVVNVYSGPANATAAQLTAVDCGSSNSGDSSVYLTTTAGTQYYVQVGSPAAGGSAVPFTFVASQYSWQQPSKVTAGGSATATSLTLTATAVADPYANSTVPATFGGVVEFLAGNGTSLGTVPLNGATATLSVPRPAAGNAAYTALFHSSTEDFRDSFRPFVVSVPKLASTLKVKAPKKVTLKATTGKNGKPVVKAKKVKLKATVTSGGTPTGTVTFQIGKKKVTGTLKNGVATVKVKIAKRTKVTVTYNGDANTATSTAKVKIKVAVKK